MWAAPGPSLPLSRARSRKYHLPRSRKSSIIVPTKGVRHIKEYIIGKNDAGQHV